jgi:2,3-bisphosphoglycerate-dependent phosphoglycerate mutase
MGTIYLVRHAHSEWTTDENRSLSQKGVEDSNRIVEILQIFPIGAIFSSPFTRAYETILPLSKRINIPIIIEPSLQERSMGTSTIIDFQKSVEALWRDTGYSYPEGESNIVAQQRGIEVLQRLLMSNLTGQIVLSTHGTLLALILNYYNNKIDYEFWKTLTIPDIYTININNKEEVSMKRLWKEK